MGGVVGIPVGILCDTDQLDTDDRNSLQAMVETVDFFSLPEKIQTSSTDTDRFFYQIMVEKTDARHTVEVSESDMPESLKQLIQRVTFTGRGALKR